VPRIEPGSPRLHGLKPANRHPAADLARVELVPLPVCVYEFQYAELGADPDFVRLFTAGTAVLRGRCLRIGTASARDLYAGKRY